MSKSKKPKIETRKTLHITVEGDAEKLIMEALKSKFTANKQGPKTTILNARGKGGRNVLRTSMRCAKKGDYDQRAIILDTDTDWGEKEKSEAKTKGITAIELHPCLESILLEAKGSPTEGNSKLIKEAFKNKFGGVAHDPKVIATHFPPEVIVEICEKCQCQSGGLLLNLFK